MRRLSAVALLLALAPLAAPAQPQTTPIDPERSTLSYDGSHPLHGWSGTSEAVSGTLRLDLADPTQSTVEVRVPVESFDSGNSNRDSNMLDVVDADQHPEVHFASERVEIEAWAGTAGGYEGRWRVHGALTFHGQTHPVTIPVDVVVTDGSFSAEGTFVLSLDRFGVRRPKLMLMPIRDELELTGRIHAEVPASLDPQGS